MLSILALSDIHERTQRFKALAKLVKEAGGVGLTIVAGDITYFKPANIAIKILEKLHEAVGSPILFIPGNCDDPRLTGSLDTSNNILNIHGKPVEAEGYIFYGIGGGGVSPFNTLIEYSEDDFNDLIRRASGIDPGRLIMVTHQPVNGFFDEVDDMHIGSKVFREFMRARQPLLWITGHIHEHSGWIRSDGTVIVHPGPFMHGYYALITISGSSVTDVSIKRI